MSTLQRSGLPQLPMASSPLPLHGLGVLITRPAQQAEPLCHLIENKGGIAIRCPALSIHAPHDWAPARTVFERLDRYDLAIFTSTNAVDYAQPLLEKWGGLPPTLEIAAIGKATARSLARLGIDRCLQPPLDFSSEGLLALPRFQNVTGQSVLLVCGEGGRYLLTETLTQRGAQVDRAAVYRRERPLVDMSRVMTQWQRGEIGAVVVTSTEILLNLFDMLGQTGQDYLYDTPLIVLSTRTRQTAAEHGCRRILIAREASDDAIIAILLGLTANPSQFSPVT